MLLKGEPHMKYTIEYHTPNSLSRIKVGNDLRELLTAIRADGCRITDDGACRALNWAETAAEGAKHYIGTAATIRKGALKMTEYTSF